MDNLVNKIKKLNDKDFNELFKLFLEENSIKQVEIAKLFNYKYNFSIDKNKITDFFKRNKKLTKNLELEYINAFFKEYGEVFIDFCNKYFINKDKEILEYFTEKVEIFNFDKLSEIQKNTLYDDFLEKTKQKKIYNPTNIPLHSSASSDKQNYLNTINRIDISVFIKLLNSFNIYISEQEFNNNFQAIDYNKYVEDIYCSVKNNGINDFQKESLNNYCDYLISNDLHANEEDLKETDLILAIGTGYGIELRMTEISKIFSKANKSKLILSGYKSYDPENKYKITQSQAMKYFFEKNRSLGVNLNRIILENRPKNFRETISLSITHIINTYKNKNKNKNKIERVNLILVTSSRSILRLNFLVKYYLKDLDHIIDINTIRYCITPEYPKQMLFDPEQPDFKLCLGLYINEFFKIIYGRLSAEF